MRDDRLVLGGPMLRRIQADFFGGSEGDRFFSVCVRVVHKSDRRSEVTFNSKLESHRPFLLYHPLS